MGMSGVISTANIIAERSESVTFPSTDYSLIPLTQGQFAKVNVADYEWLNQWKWYAVWSEHSKSFYALRFTQKTELPKHRGVRMHRVILGLGFGDKRQGDHQNRDTLDNRRNNLRIATHAQNQQNSKMPTNNKSGYKGVSWYAQCHCWQAHLMVEKRRIYLGRFATPQDAHLAYCAAAKEYHGEFARI